MSSTDGSAETGAGEAGGSDGFSVVVGKKVLKRLQREREDLEALKKESVTFRVVIKELVDNEEGGKSEMPFKSGLMAVFDQLLTWFPSLSLKTVDGAVVVWANSCDLVQKLMNIKKIGAKDVKVSCPAAENMWTYITGVDEGFSDDEILKSLETQGLLRVRRGSRKLRNGKVVKSGVVHLLFRGIAPASITLAQRIYSVMVDPGRPLICYKCQRLGHTSRECNGEVSCRKCGQRGHVMKDCKNKARCPNCKGPHVATSKECPRLCIAMEKLTTVASRRVTERARAVHQNIAVQAIPSPPLVASAQTPTVPIAVGRKTYANVASAVVVAGGAGPQVVANLPVAPKTVTFGCMPPVVAKEEPKPKKTGPLVRPGASRKGKNAKKTQSGRGRLAEPRSLKYLTSTVRSLSKQIAGIVALLQGVANLTAQHD